ncbi:type III polyketide synthase [Paenibacillus rigui]|uniref:Type III polyketide synthase n=1 Tax=Paenibacillus rigui TaxID=554312 RepID=A0A229UVK6_9BACL|nr:type III polyketide synthase [Paenibacillus rigui]OXM87472.1 type III polyketide synthase [Paenibacillus rigui]
MEIGAGRAAIIGIGTALPPFRMDQGETAARIAEALQEHPDSMRWAKRIFKQCGVDSRYTCLPELLEPAAGCRYSPGTPADAVPTTAERMAVYRREAVPLGLEAARSALADAGVEPAGITHLITVSCTGQFLPGLDAVITESLGLSRRVQRIPFNFLGCAAGLKGVCLAQHLIRLDSAARVLVVCVELCTLHMQSSAKREDLYAASFFGDGASACVVAGSSGSKADRSMFLLGDDRSVLMPEYAEEMVWEVGNHGFNLYLSPSIPRRIEELIPPQIEGWFADEPLPKLWAIHPGGKGIVDAVQASFGLSDEQVDPSRTVLMRYGNLSSATILFVLQQMRSQLIERDIRAEEGIAMAFGPGLTAELLRFRYVSGEAVVPEERVEDAYV